MPSIRQSRLILGLVALGYLSLPAFGDKGSPRFERARIQVDKQKVDGVAEGQRAPSPLSEKTGTFALELEVTNDEIFNADYDYKLEDDTGAERLVTAHATEANHEARASLVRAIRDLCKRRGDCQVEAIRGEVSWSWGNGSGGIDENFIEAYRVTYTKGPGRGFRYELTLDPGVIEVKALGTRDQFVAIQDRFQADFYEVAARQGLKPNVGEMHLHEGLRSNYGSDLMAARNRFVDKLNNEQFAYLFANVENDSLDNTPPLSALPEDKYATVQGIIRQVDDGFIVDQEEFFKRVRKDVYNVTRNMDWVTDWDPAQKYQAFNVQRTKKSLPAAFRTLESRMMPMAQNAKDAADVVRLEAARIKYLTSRPDRVVLMKYNPKASMSHHVAMLKRYIDEAASVDPSIRWEDYKRFVPQSLQGLKNLPELAPTVWAGDPARPDCSTRALHRVLKPLVIKQAKGKR
jgi:hypothetical protein